MKINIKNVLLGGITLFSIGASAQKTLVQKAAKKYDDYSFVEAAKIYERVYNKNFESQELLQNTGNAFYFNGDLSTANNWYTKLFLLNNESIDSEYFYRYAQTLKAIGKYTLADAYLQKFSEIEKEDSRARMLLADQKYLATIRENSGHYSIGTASVSGAYSDYGSTVLDGNLIFASNRAHRGVSRNIHTWTEQSFTRLYSAKIKNDGTLKKSKTFASEITSRFNESTPVFSKDGKTMYFTSNNDRNGVRQTNSKGITLLKIYSATLENNRWTKVTELPFNSDEFSTAHPALTPDGNWIYFASDREGSLGQSDLFKVRINATGGFGEPINLGSQINTEGRESFPVITVDNELYFATDGRPGLGGLDIYGTKINQNDTYSDPKNLGAPINSPLDDFGYYIDSSTRQGFMTSNRNGSDDIFAFLEKTRVVLECKQIVHGSVYDLPTGQILSKAKLTLYDNEFHKIAETISDATGNFEFKNLDCGSKYRINVVAEDYNTAEITVIIPNASGTTLTNFGLEKTRVIIKQGDDLFKVLKLEPIYFDFDKSEIRADAAIELAKVVAVLKEYPLMNIDVRSHSDSRGKDSYNLKLSDDRAKSTAKWIINQGIDSSRIDARGYGETQLINDCSNGVRCTDEEHQVNRRSEFIVLKL